MALPQAQARRHLACLHGCARLLALFADFVSPYRPETISRLNTFAPPNVVRLFHDGSLQWPFIYALKRKRDPETARVIYEEDTTKPLPVRFFVEGETYHLLGLVETNASLRCRGPQAADQPLRYRFPGAAISSPGSSMAPASPCRPASSVLPLPLFSASRWALCRVTTAAGSTVPSSG
ncbi:hypothetical protein V6L77_09330 [Pannonibacter sp. Pt2-lr]